MLYSKEASKFKRERSFYGDGWWRMTCVVCGDEFDSNQSYAKYCSARCANDAAMAARRQRLKDKREAADHCLVCGRPIEQSETAKIRKYCSNACKQKAYRAKKAGNPYAPVPPTQYERDRAEAESRRSTAEYYRKLKSETTISPEGKDVKNESETL